MNNEKFLKALIAIIILFSLSFYVHPRRNCQLLQQLCPENRDLQKRIGLTLFVLCFGEGVAFIPALLYRLYFCDWLPILSLIVHITTMLLAILCSRKR